MNCKHLWMLVTYDTIQGSVVPYDLCLRCGAEKECKDDISEAEWEQQHRAQRILQAD